MPGQYMCVYTQTKYCKYKAIAVQYNFAIFLQTTPVSSILRLLALWALTSNMPLAAFEGKLSNQWPIFLNFRLGAV